MDPRPAAMRAVRVDGCVLVECETCGPIAVLASTDTTTEALFVTAHIIEHRTGRTVVVKEQQ